MTGTIERAAHAFFKLGPLGYIKQLNRIGDPKVGKYIGKDSFGNKFYESQGEDEINLRTRWVDFGQYYSEPTIVESGWHSWLSHTVDTPPPALTKEQKAIQAAPGPKEYWTHTATPGNYVPYSTVRPFIQKVSWAPTVKERVH